MQTRTMNRWFNPLREGEGEGGGGGVPDNSPWYQKAGVAADHHEWLAGKQFADPSVQVASHRSLEQLIGRQRLAVPKDANDTEALDAIFKTLGRPDKPEGYALKDGSKINPETFKSFAPIFHKHGANPALVAEITEAYEGLSVKAAETKAAEAAAREVREIAELEAAWSTNTNANTDIASRAFRHLGLSEDETQALEGALGYKRTMELMHQIGAGMSESAMHQDGRSGGGGGETLADLQSALNSKFADKAFMERYKNHNPRVRKDAIEEVQKLQIKIADLQAPPPPIQHVTKRGTSLSDRLGGAK